MISLTRATGALAILGLAMLAYLRFLRAQVLDWGSTREEARSPLPGDELVPDPAICTTRSITILAEPEDIWPWLVQMGPRPRAGAYTYAWVERLLGIDIENSDEILPQFQHLEPGEFLGVDKRGVGLEAREVRPNEALVVQWRPADSTWAFVLQPGEDGSTRLLSRNRIPGGGAKFWLGMVLFMEPGSLVMERRMLQGIRERAERHAADRLRPGDVDPGM